MSTTRRRQTSTVEFLATITGRQGREALFRLLRTPFRLSLFFFFFLFLGTYERLICGIGIRNASGHGISLRLIGLPVHPGLLTTSSQFASARRCEFARPPVRPSVYFAQNYARTYHLFAQRIDPCRYNWATFSLSPFAVRSGNTTASIAFQSRSREQRFADYRILCRCSARVQRERFALIDKEFRGIFGFASTRGRIEFRCCGFN